ncbi:hypothetical protein A9K55_003041 [Cordyceps militaris]|uniref:Uncharacterized protein n=1 Tax=Cordyceps militaris TaxID=73501 RepID=A0A2H4S5V8_CORMI|nr:hypothetical protein A9K55_003041 [Cordyceps militaris]
MNSPVPRNIILLLVAIFLFNLDFASPLLISPASSLSHLLPRGNITDDGSLSDPLVTVTPVAFDIRLPWWTDVPGTAISLLIAAVTVSGGWVRPSKGDVPLTKASLAWNGFTTVLLFFQSLSGLIHLLLSFRSSDRYSLHQVWDQALLEHPKTLLVAGWINITLSLLAFVLFSLPIIGSAPLFHASSPFCTWVLNDGTGFQTTSHVTASSDAVCGVLNWLNQSSVSPTSTISQTQIRCANADALRLGYTGAYNTLTTIGDYAHLAQSPWLGWAFAVIVAVLLILTARMQWRRNLYRPVPFREDETEDRTERWTSKVMMALFILSLAISLAVLIAQHDYQAVGFSGSLVVCPDVSNSTSYTNLGNTTLEKEKRALGRVFYNFF